jgi:hypothetical protein
MLGNFLCTAARTAFFSASVPFAATLAKALRALSIVSMGYLRSLGKAKSESGRKFLLFVSSGFSVKRIMLYLLGFYKIAYLKVHQSIFDDVS